MGRLAKSQTRELVAGISRTFVLELVRFGTKRRTFFPIRYKKTTSPLPVKGKPSENQRPGAA